MDLQKKYTLLLQGNKECNLKTQTLMESLFFNPYITTPNAMKITNSSFPTAKNHIGLLEQSGIIKKINISDSKAQFYLAEELLNTIMQRE
jgi:Fic family protein